MELSQEPARQDYSLPATEIEGLRDAIKRLLGEGTAPDETMTERIMSHLVETGHVVPGAPPASHILRDAQSFAERLTLSNLALRILNMLAFSSITTPETAGARRWIDDYLEGRNHGPVGHPMLWPGGLPGMAKLLGDWGFKPTIAVPGSPSFVARALDPVTQQ